MGRCYAKQCSVAGLDFRVGCSLTCLKLLDKTHIYAQCIPIHIFISQFAIFRVFQEVNGS